MIIVAEDRPDIANALASSLQREGIASTVIIGGLSAGSANSLSVAVPGGKALTLSLANMTQLASSFSVANAAINGDAPSAVGSVQIGSDGTLTAVYAGGSRIPSYRIPLANVASPDNLHATSGDVFVTTPTSGDMIVSNASTGANGTILSGALEQSTVDFSGDLTQMIEAQRSYTANSKGLPDRCGSHGHPGQLEALIS